MSRHQNINALKLLQEINVRHVRFHKHLPDAWDSSLFTHTHTHILAMEHTFNIYWFDITYDDLGTSHVKNENDLPNRLY